jgi:hypothetical protein
MLQIDEIVVGVGIIPKALLADSRGIERSRYRGGIGGGAGGGWVV